MAKDTIAKAIEVMLMGTPAGIARSAPKKIQNLIKKTMKEKKITGKPKGTGSALGVVGSASKAGMQKKQKSPFNIKVTNSKGPMPKPTGRPPKSVFLRKKPKPKPTGRPPRVK